MDLSGQAPLENYPNFCTEAIASLECVVCRNRHSDICTAVVGYCGHSFCHTCVDRFSDCPICGVKSFVSPVRNFLAIDIMEVCNQLTSDCRIRRNEVSSRICPKEGRPMPRKNPVAISSDLVEDFFPQTKVPPPVSTSSTVSVSAPRPLDEIGLLKKGRLNTKYQRRMSLEDVEKPITLEEMARRGMLTKTGRLVHRLPTSSTCSSKGTTPSPSSMLSTGGGALSKVFEEAVISSKTYDVGLPEERAQLKIGQTTRGERLELIVAHQFHAILDLSDKCKTLVTFKP